MTKPMEPVGTEQELIKTLKHHIQRKDEQIIALTDALDAQRGDFQDLLAQYERVKRQLKDACEQLAQTAAKNEATPVELPFAELHELVGELSVKVENQRGENHRIRAVIVQRNNLIRALDFALKEQDKELDDALRRISELRAENEQLKATQPLEDEQ